MWSHWCTAMCRNPVRSHLLQGDSRWCDWHATVCGRMASNLSPVTAAEDAKVTHRSHLLQLMLWLTCHRVCEDGLLPFTDNSFRGCMIQPREGHITVNMDRTRKAFSNVWTRNIIVSIFTNTVMNTVSQVTFRYSYISVAGYLTSSIALIAPSNLKYHMLQTHTWFYLLGFVGGAGLAPYINAARYTISWVSNHFT